MNHPGGRERAYSAWKMRPVGDSLKVYGRSKRRQDFLVRLGVLAANEILLRPKVEAFYSATSYRLTTLVVLMPAGVHAKRQICKGRLLGLESSLNRVFFFLRKEN